MTVDDLLQVIDRLAPTRLAEEWDNVGLLVGRRGQPVGGVMVALDLRPQVIDEAAAAGCDVVLTHHPVIFPALGAVSDATAAGSLVLRAASEGVAVIAAHTNLDSAHGGLNDLMAAALGVQGTRPLRPSPVDVSVGLGRVGNLAAPTTLGALTELCRRAFGLSAVRVVGGSDRVVSSVAVCTGSGGSLVGDAVAAGVDVYVTGDLKYHDADAAGSVALLDVAHGAVEEAMLRAWTPALIAALGDGTPVRFAATSTDPWRVATTG